MKQAQSPANQSDRPWYYRNWFLFPTFILGWPVLPIPMLWPVWAVLIIRSPWHRGFVAGTLAWAMLMAGGWMLVLRLRDPESTLLFVLISVPPGVVLTAITQVLWSQQRGQYLIAAGDQEPTTQVVKGPVRSRGERLRRRGRRRNPRPGRYSRHPF